jgi:UDP-N-acetylmuramyl pentapeptide phosphotransferase/UDP-N-acetylglucosamine-1-phosphate transferase
MFFIILTAFFISFISQIIVIYLFKRKGFFVDEANTKEPQKFHKTPTPRAGGIGIFLSNIVLFSNPLGIKFVLAGFPAFLSGILEDFHRSLSPKKRLFFQALSGILAVVLIGAVVKEIRIIEFPYIVGALFSIFAIVGAINAINIIDGFNGLASGISLMILTSFGIVSFLQKDIEILMVILVNIGAIIGFMIFNFPKGKIFLGDGGAYFLGFVIAEIAILLPYRHEIISPWFSLAVLIYPVWEVVFSFYRKKIIKGTSPFEPDKFHFHMLINKRITRDNPKTSVFIWSLVAPFTFLPVLYYNNTIACAFTALLFIMTYNALYAGMVKFKINF